MKIKQYIPTWKPMPEPGDIREIIDRDGNAVALGVVYGVLPAERTVLIRALNLTEDGEVTTAVPPGKIIKEQLDRRVMTKVEFAEKMGMTYSEVEKLISGETKLVYDIPERLEKVFGLPVVFWQRLEDVYRKKVAV